MMIASPTVAVYVIIIIQDVQLRRASLSGWSSLPSLCLRDIWSLGQILSRLLRSHDEACGGVPLVLAPEDLGDLAQDYGGRDPS